MTTRRTKPGSLDDGPKGPRLKGVFSRPEPGGAGEKSFWFVKEIDDATVSMQRLDENMLPTGKQSLSDRDAFMLEFSLEPDLAYKLLTQRVIRGDFYRKQDKNLEAKIEYQQVLRIDEENIRANFGLGLSYLALNQLDKAKYVFENIVGMDESFGEEHKHLFNEFGIALRKKKLFDEALEYYSRSAQLCPTDENIFLNMTRAAFESGEMETAFANLKKTLEINPEMHEARAFLSYLRKNNLLPEDPKLAAFFRWAATSPKPKAEPKTKRWDDDIPDVEDVEPED